MTREDFIDLIVRNVRLADRPVGELLDIGVARGRIVAIESGQGVG
jgi:hypothetical protein